METTYSLTDCQEYLSYVIAHHHREVLEILQDFAGEAAAGNQQSDRYRITLDEMLSGRKVHQHDAYALILKLNEIFDKKYNQVV